MKLLLLALLLFVLSTSKGEVDTETNDLNSWSDFQALTIKKLREYLNAKGLQCKGCTEKKEFVDMAYDARNLPIKSEEPERNNQEYTDDKAEELRELMEKLKGSGMGAKLFTADDLKNLTPEQLSAKLSGKGNKSKKKSVGKKKTDKKKESSSQSSSSSPKVNKQGLDSETIEL